MPGDATNSQVLLRHQSLVTPPRLAGLSSPRQLRGRSVVSSRCRPLRVWIDRVDHELSIYNVGKIIDINSILATATIDRLVHYREAYVLQGTSYRTKDNTHDAE